MTNSEVKSAQCALCPRKCGVIRSIKMGYCQSGNRLSVARAALHFGEEPCISGTRGSGAIFFSGCSLRCVFCQNSAISRSSDFGKEITPKRLSDIMLELQSKGAHNINLVTPTHFVPDIIKALDTTPLGIPVAYNCAGYELISTLKQLEGKVQIYMPDMKYSISSAAAKYSLAPDYVEIAKAAIMEMYRQTGPYVLDRNGVMQGGVLIRHLILPWNIKNSLGVIDWVANTFSKGSVLFSLMSQYTPFPSQNLPRELSRSITAREYRQVEAYLHSSGIEDGFVQELSSADLSFVPKFDYTGV